LEEKKSDARKETMQTVTRQTFWKYLREKTVQEKKGEAVHIKDPIYIPYQTEERKMRKMNAYELPKT
jgi:hypothetical protein